MKEMEFAPSIS